MPRTRRQVTLQEQESGVPASPPQSLPTVTRPTRAKRITSRTDTSTVPAGPPPSTQAGPAVRSGRIGKAKKAARSRAQLPATTSEDAPKTSTMAAMDVDTPEASDSSSHVVAAQPSPTILVEYEVDGELEYLEEPNVDPHGETQSPTDVSAHPVQILDMNALPVQGPTTPPERRESATSLIFRDILEGSPSPRSNPEPSLPNAVAPIAPLNPTIETPLAAPIPDTVAPVSSSPSSPLSPFFKPAPQAPNPPSEPTIYYVPSNPDRSHSLITLHVDHIQGSKDPIQPSMPAAFVVPSDLIAPICRYIESRANPDSDLSKLTTDHPVVKALVQGDARYRPQLPSWHSQRSPKPPGSTMRDAFIKKAQRTRCFREMEEETATLKAENVQRNRGFREMEEETATLRAENAKLKAKAVGASPSSTLGNQRYEGFQSNESPPKRTRTVPDPYTPDGTLMLGRTKEIEVDEHGIAVNPMDEPTMHWHDMEARQRAQLEEARRIATMAESPNATGENADTDGPALEGRFTESQDQVQPEQMPETPRARRWGLSNFLPSARSVTKYIPFSSRRANPTLQHRPIEPQHLTQIEPRVNAGSSQAQPTTSVADPVPTQGHRHHPSTSNQQRLLTKEQWEEEQRLKKMRAQLRRDAASLERQKKDLEIVKKDFAEQQRLADNAQTPGQKRKRLSSPDVIPLPAGGGYGMVDEYFIVDSSSDEEDLVAQETPTKGRPLKKARTGAPNTAIFGNPFRARPYTGTLFAHPDAQRSPRDDNVFIESNEPDTDPALDSTPPPGPTLTFKVPSPGSSDSDDDEDDEQELNHNPKEAPSHSILEPKSILRNSTSNQSQPRPTTNFSSTPKSMAPPPRPTAGHPALPAAATMNPSDALEKARERALKHQPKQPSTLRESSRLSTSTTNSDPGDEAHIEEYDPAHPAILPSPSKAPVFIQPINSAAPAFVHPVASTTAPTGFQQPATQAISEQSQEQQAMPLTSEKQAGTTRDISAAAPADDGGSRAEQTILAEKQNEDLDNPDQSVAKVNPKIKADLDHYWEEHGDDYALDDGYEEFQAGMIAEEQELMDGENDLPYIQPVNILSEALARAGADCLAEWGIQTQVEDNWRPGDLERTEIDPVNGMRVFFNRLVKNGDLNRELADGVMAMGVPPGITEYLAGQGAEGPVTA